MMFKRKFKLQNGLESFGYINLDQVVDISFIVEMIPQKDDTDQPLKNEAGEDVFVLQEAAVLTLPWAVQKLLPKPVYQPAGKGSQRISHYTEEPVWVNNVIVVSNPDEVQQLKDYYQSL